MQRNKSTSCCGFRSTLRETGGQPDSANWHQLQYSGQMEGVCTQSQVDLTWVLALPFESCVTTSVASFLIKVKMTWTWGGPVSCQWNSIGKQPWLRPKRWLALKLCGCNVHLPIYWCSQQFLKSYRQICVIHIILLSLSEQSLWKMEGRFGSTVILL